MASVSTANSGEVFPLLTLPGNENGLLERVFGNVGLKGMVALSSVSKLIRSFVFDSGPTSMGGRLWRGMNDSAWTGYIKQRAKCSVIDQNIWRTSPRLSQFLAENGLEVPPERLGLDWRKDVLPGLKAVDSLKIENDAGMTYIVVPKGVTWRMVNGLLAQALGKPTCFKYITQCVPTAYWDIPVEMAYAFVITNSVIENSRGASLQWRIELPGKNGCEVIDGLEHLTLLALTYIVTQEQSTSGRGVRLYRNDPWTLTCVRVNDLIFEIGGFSLDGLYVYYYGNVDPRGSGALRRFRPLPLGSS